MSKKYLVINLSVLAIALISLAVVNVVFGAPTGTCGDGIVQSPNGAG